MPALPELSHQVSFAGGPPDDIQYIFTEDNPLHTCLIDSETLKTAYTVVTEFPGHDIVTKVRKASGDTIGSLEWKDALPDRVKYKDDKVRSINTWLKAKSLLNPVR